LSHPDPSKDPTLQPVLSKAACHPKGIEGGLLAVTPASPSLSLQMVDFNQDG
jgi:hypothetical protein